MTKEVRFATLDSMIYKIIAIMAVLVTASSAARAQSSPVASPAPTPPAPVSVPRENPIVPSAASPTITPIDVAAEERLMFQLGDYLGRAAFTNAVLVQKINNAGITASSADQLSLLEKLAPEAQQNRADQLGYLLAAQQLMWNIRAPEKAIKPVSVAVHALRSPPVNTGENLELAKTDTAAAFTLAVLQEYPRISNLPEAPVLQRWISTAAKQHNGHVWYTEGFLAGLSFVAAKEKKPDLLPNASEIATDLQGQLDWITIRLPDSPTPDQIALRNSVAALLTSVTRFDHAKDCITQYQLRQLGQINKTIEGEVFGMTPPSTTTASAK